MDLQERIDAQAYPPTMQYRLSDLTATGMLAVRAVIWAEMTPEFFWPGKKVLDVGANKGYFSQKCASLLRDLLLPAPAFGPAPKVPHKVEHTTFRDYVPAHRFDSIFMGNVWHYLYKESEGWDWLAKLAAMTKDRGKVYIEGPTGMECSDMERVLPPGNPLREKFAWPEFLKVAWRWFTVSARRSACEYTPDRYVFTLTRKTRMGSAEADMPLIRPLRVYLPAWEPPSGHKDRSMGARIFGGRGLVTKVCREPIGVREQMRIEISEAAPYSSPLLGWVLNRNNDVCGWFEPFLRGHISKFFLDEDPIFSKYLDRQLFFLHNGYFDEDSGQPNWIQTPVSGAEPVTQFINFDKNGLTPVRGMRRPSILTRARKGFDHAYKTLPPELVDGLIEAMASADADTLIKAYKAARSSA